MPKSIKSSRLKKMWGTRLPLNTCKPVQGGNPETTGVMFFRSVSLFLHNCVPGIPAWFYDKASVELLMQEDHPYTSRGSSAPDVLEDDYRLGMK